MEGEELNIAIRELKTLIGKIEVNHDALDEYKLEYSIKVLTLVHEIVLKIYELRALLK